VAQKIKQLYPLKINRFAVHNGELHYRDFSKEPSVDCDGGSRPNGGGLI